MILPLKIKPGRQSLEKGLSCIFQAIGNRSFTKCRASMTKHRRQSTEVRAKGIDPTWSQVCSLSQTEQGCNGLVVEGHRQGTKEWWEVWNKEYEERVPKGTRGFPTSDFVPIVISSTQDGPTSLLSTHARVAHIGFHSYPRPPKTEAVSWFPLHREKAQLFLDIRGIFSALEMRK